MDLIIRHPMIKSSGGGYLLLPFASAFLLTIAFNTNLFYLIFIALVPVLCGLEIVLKRCDRKGLAIYLSLIYFMLILWNVFTAGWILRINVLGCIIVVICNSLIYLVPFIFCAIFKSRNLYFLSILSFITLWLSIEYIHNNWELSFPYLSLGYVIAKMPSLIQWYEILGVHGGTLWILLINVYVFLIVLGTKLTNYHFILFLICLFPIFLSKYLNSKSFSVGNRVRFLIVHPNINCYTYKYKVAPNDLVNNYINLMSPNMDDKIDYILLPETAITEYLNFNNIFESKTTSVLKHWLRTFPNATLISGAIINERIKFNPFLENREQFPNLKFNSVKNFYYYTYNAAISFGYNAYKVPIYTKRKLVPIEETIPYAYFFNFLTKHIKSLGGFGFSYRKDDIELFSNSLGVNVAPVVCYESLFGEFVAQKVRNGANVIAVVLNEGWYKNMIASSHFVNFSVVRAIENRRSIVRSSNDGISCVIDQRGNILQELSGFTPGVIKSTVVANSELSFYTKHGDITGKSSIFGSLIMVLILTLRKKRVKAGS